MDAIKLYTILLFGLWFVAVKGWGSLGESLLLTDDSSRTINHCCFFGHLYRYKDGTIRCVFDVGMPTYINEKKIPVKLSLSQCIDSIRKTTGIISCKEGAICTDALYDEESNLVVGVLVEFSNDTKEEWIPFTDVPRSKVKVCDPKSIHPNNIVDLHVPERFGQTQQENDFIKLNCSYKDHNLIGLGYFIEDPFLNSPMRDHPLVLYFKERVEQIDYCAYNHRWSQGLLEDDKEACSSMITCNKQMAEFYDVSRKALRWIGNSSERTMLKNLLVCSAKNEFLTNATILETKKLMFASPLELKNAYELLPLLDMLGGHEQLIATIIKDNGTELSYWRRNERKLDCPQGIKRLENVTIEDGHGRLYKMWLDSLEFDNITFRVCLSPTNDGRLDGYFCEGYSEPVPTTTTTEKLNTTVEVSTAKISRLEVSTVKETVLTSTEKPSSANGILISAFLIPIISFVTLSIQ